MSDFWGKNIPKLGFGLMRLPKNDDGSIDLEQTKAMVDLFVDAGLTYFDTAYVYDDGKSEEAARECLVNRHPRRSFTLATKLNAMVAKDEEDAKKQFYTSLERTGAGYFDYYLLHALMRSNYELYEKYHLWDFVKELKEKGYIKHWGFSFHGDPALLEEILSKHPDTDFIQLQINYADWENPNIAAKECFEIARKYNKSIVVMEPLKGGALADPPSNVKDVFTKANPNTSVASWAIRYVAGMDGIITVLSGMSNMEQMKDNLSYMAHFEPLSDAEKAVVAQAQDELKKIKTIECTSCHYCTPGCPVQMPIPEIFAASNLYAKMERWDAKSAYKKAVGADGAATPDQCVKCGACESACPQHLPIIKLLEEATETFAK